jgi:hypothetical protein
VAYARWAAVTGAFLPAIAFVHSGFELAETYPINTGLDFTREQLNTLPSERLPLFSEYGYDWRRKSAFPRLVSRVLAVRRRYRTIVADPSPSSFRMLDEPNPRILAFARSGGHTHLGVLGNMNFSAGERASTALESRRQHVTDLLTGDVFEVKDGRLQADLRPGQALVFVY